MPTPIEIMIDKATGYTPSSKIDIPPDLSLILVKLVDAAIRYAHDSEGAGGQVVELALELESLGWTLDERAR